MARKEAQAETLLCIYVFMPRTKKKKEKRNVTIQKRRKKSKPIAFNYFNVF